MINTNLLHITYVHACNIQRRYKSRYVNIKTKLQNIKGVHAYNIQTCYINCYVNIIKTKLLNITYVYNIKILNIHTKSYFSLYIRLDPLGGNNHWWCMQCNQNSQIRNNSALARRQTVPSILLQQCSGDFSR